MWSGQALIIIHIHIIYSWAGSHPRSLQLTILDQIILVYVLFADRHIQYNTCEDRPTPLKSPDLELTDLISTRLLWGLNNTVNLISATRCSGCAIQSPAMLLLVFSKHPAGSLSLDHVHFAESYALNDFIR